MKVLLSAEVFSVIVLGILGIGVICKIWWGLLYLKLLKETNNMSKTKNSQLRALMLQFEKKYQVKKGIKNIELFVDKHVSQIKIGGLHMQNANKVSLSLAMISIIYACICAWWSYLGNGQIVKAVQYIMEGVLVALILCGLHFMLDFEIKRENIIVNIQEYLENVLINKLEINNRELIMAQDDKQAILESDSTNPKSEKIEDNILFKELLEEIFP